MEKIIIVMFSSEHYSGPISPPEQPVHYNNASPDAASRIIEMVETEQDVRHKLQITQLDFHRKQLEFNHRILSRGQFLAVTAVILIVSLCALMVCLGTYSQAATVASAVIVFLAGVFYLEE